MKNYLTFKHLQRSLKFLLLLSLFFGVSNCKRDIDGPCGMTDKTFDTSYFEKNEKDLLPDWEGDSLFFYSNAGDTAYLFCKSQGLVISAKYGGGGSTWCSWTDTYPYELFVVTYSSNNPELNDTRIEIYKESYSQSHQSNPPLRQAKIEISNWNTFKLLVFDGKTAPNDSILLANGEYEKGWIREDIDRKTILNLNVGLIKMEMKNVKKWTLFRYTLAN